MPNITAQFLSRVPTNLKAEELVKIEKGKIYPIQKLLENIENSRILCNIHKSCKISCRISF